LASLVLFAAVLAALDSALFKVWHPYWGDAALPPVTIHVDCSIAGACYSTRPGWAIPMAIAIGLAGILVATVLYRPRSTSRGWTATPIAIGSAGIFASAVLRRPRSTSR
jgi:hypothetical protein